LLIIFFLTSLKNHRIYYINTNRRYRNEKEGINIRHYGPSRNTQILEESDEEGVYQEIEEMEEEEPMSKPFIIAIPLN